MNIPRASGPTSLQVPAHFTAQQTAAVLRQIRMGIAIANRIMQERYTPKEANGA